MTILTIPAILLSTAAIVYLVYIFVMLSRKLGAVTKMKPFYRWLYIAMALIAISFVSRWLMLTPYFLPETAPGMVSSEWFEMLGSTLPLIAAAGLALAVVLRYWGWLFREQVR